MFDYLIIGKGLIGAAATRYLSQTARRVAVIGPDEPQDWATHQGVYASHYDQGRITRILDPDRVWALLAQRSIGHYRTLEQQSGIPFYQVTNGLRVGRLNGPGYRTAQAAAIGEQLGVNFQTYPSAVLKTIYPVLNFPAGLTCLLERGGAGYINPRKLIRAQLTLASRNGAAIINERVIAIERSPTHVTLKNAKGQTYQTRKLLISAGAYTNHLLGQPLPLTPNGRTILLAQLPAAEVTRLKTLPTLIYWQPDHPALNSIYLLPPIQYTDGHTYLKIGGDHTAAPTLASPDALRDWFHSSGSPAEAEALQTVLCSLIPSLKVLSFQTKPCVTTYTPTQRPLLMALTPGQVYVAAGGCGAAAKSSDEIGRLAAQLLLHDAWTDPELDEALFRVSGDS